MALAIDLFSQGAFSSADPWTHATHSVAAGSDLILIVYLTVDGAHSLNSITWNGVAMSPIDSHTTGPSSVQTGYLYALVNPDTGAHNVVADFAAAESGVISAISFSGAHQTVTFGTVVKDTLASIGTREPVTPGFLALTTASGDYGLSFCSPDGNRAASMAVAGETSAWVLQGALNISTLHSAGLATCAAPLNPENHFWSWTGSDDAGAMAVALKPASGAPATWGPPFGLRTNRLVGVGAIA